jgi:hypothetical protein
MSQFILQKHLTLVTATKETISFLLLMLFLFWYSRLATTHKGYLSHVLCFINLLFSHIHFRLPRNSLELRKLKKYILSNSFNSIRLSLLNFICVPYFPLRGPTLKHRFRCPSLQDDIGEPRKVIKTPTC